MVSEQLFLPPCTVFLFQKSDYKSVSQYVFSDWMCYNYYVTAKVSAFYGEIHVWIFAPW